MMCLMACLSINVSAAEIESIGQCGENAYWSFDESTGTLTISGIGKIDDAVVFDEETGDILFDENTGDPVWNMPWYDFKNQIYTLVIEEGITEIGACAFHSFYFLTEVDFPSTLEVVGCAAFCDCIRLEELDFPDSVHTLYVSNYNEIAIKKIVLPASLETTPTIPGIDGIFDFNMCAYLESLTIPEEIGAIEAIVSAINPSIRNIYNYSTEAIIKFDNGGISQYWWGDEATAEYVTVSISAELASIEYEMTEEELEAFVLEKIIEYYGEAYAEKIPEPVLIDTVPDYIKAYCYENSAQHLYCVENNINFVLIDENTHLDSNNDCICDICGLKHMCGEKVYYEFDENAGIFTLKGEGETYSYEWREAPFSYMNDINRVVVEEGITTLGNTIFQECSFEYISLPHSLEKIGDFAFDNCDFKVLYLYENLEYIGQDVFRECYELEKIIVDNNNPYYFSDEAGALYNKDVTELVHYPAKSSTTEYSIPETVISFSSHAFAYCENLKILNIPSAVTYIESNFYACNSIEKFVVAEDNLVYSSDERGVLFDKNKTLLIKYPEGNKEIKYTVPDSVITIGELSVHMCDYLEEIYIGDNVSYIEIGALSRNAALRKIEVAENNLDYCTDEDGVLFNKDKSILYQYTTGHPRKTYTIPNTVTKLSACSFEGSVNLNTSIVIPSSVTHIEDWVFPGKSFDFIYYSGTEEQWNSIQIDGYNDNLYAATIHFNYDGTEPIITNSGFCGENVVFKLYSDGTLIISGTGEMWDYGEADITTYFPPYITCEFDENDDPLGDFTIKKAVIEDGVTRIGNYAFQGCRVLKEVEIADTVTSIGEAAFDYCTSLKHIKIPGSVKVLEQEAFSESALETIEIEEGLERIETLAFFYCLNLKDVNLPESVECIGDFAFLLCDKLETLIINNKDCEIGLEILMTVELDEDGNIVEDENGKLIPTECPTVLKGYSGSTAETYAKSMTEAGYPIKFEALDVHIHLDSDKNGKCDNCGEIFIVDEGNCGAEGDNVTWTFYSDGKLVISGNGEMADNFFEFSKLDIKNVIIESGVTTIGGWAFVRCDDLVSIEIPDTVTSIGDSAFSGCESLTAVTIPTSVTTIGKAAFFNCKSLESVAIPTGITSISELSFCGCKNLTSVSIKKSVTSVGKTAFDGCTSLADVYYDGTAQDWDKITIKSGNDPLINATKNFGAVCRHTEDGHETVTTEEIIDEPTFFDDGSYAEITKCKNCGAELSREIKTIPDVSLLDTIAEEIEEFFKGPISAIANVFKRILRIFGKR